ncbi:DegT/DnrJ/EryC1/StrS family aminotransferase [Bremerella sp. JC770]|uniref:DegT/DnrJ/EryC1/StrS family aminotransferase n=1 Tax=Bremerella sp. JC770 TaxID=3232137 RepID=UPI0034578B5F
MIPIAKPSLGEQEAVAAANAVRSGWVTQGPMVQRFEEAIAEYCQTKYAVAVSNCTTALHLACLVLDLGPGDEVICPSMSFIATANSIRYTGATVVFADVDPRTYNLDPASVEAAITPRTKAIMVVHQIGLPADMDRFLELGEKHGIKIFEDAACAIGSRYKGTPIGGHSEMACFSLHPRKVITTGEGGLITTNNSAYAQHLRLLRQHGMSVPDLKRHQSRQVITEQYEVLGYNYRMTDIQAAIGLEQLKKLDTIVARRQELAAAYSDALKSHPWLTPPMIPDYAKSTFQSYAVQLSANAPVSRDQLMQQLLDEQVATRRGIMLSHLEAPYQSPTAAYHLPQSELASAQSLLLPLFASMTDQDLNQVLTTIGQLT